MSPTEFHDVTIQTLQQEHFQSTVDLFVRAFCDSEPLTKYLNVYYQDYEPFAKEVVLKAIKEGTSKVAVNKDHKVVAFNITEDLADPFIPHFAHYPKIKPIFALLHQLSKPFTDGKKFLRGKIIHVWLAAVDERYRGQGLSTKIDMASIELAAKKGFDFAYAEFTNDLSEKVTEQFKTLDLINTINFEDFTFEGNKPFKGLPGKATAYTATIRPGVKLDDLSHCYKIAEKL